VLVFLLAAVERGGVVVEMGRVCGRDHFLRATQPPKPIQNLIKSFCMSLEVF
jgi:hypothetical protein